MGLNSAMRLRVMLAVYSNKARRWRALSCGGAMRPGDQECGGFVGVASREGSAPSTL